MALSRRTLATKTALLALQRAMEDAGTVPGIAVDRVAAYIARVCSNAEIYLNGSIIFSGGHMAEPLTRNCYRPQLVSLPAALLNPLGNVLDIQVRGSALKHVAVRTRAAPLAWRRSRSGPAWRSS